ncbi:MAG: hypothetical protein FWE35_15380 [Streptosporangiales bacterium]|nr:hypothetical protein [Streptosporangiales bacterium]
MICVSCRERRHSECRGGSWCDCQHLPPEFSDAPEAAEPQVSWVRQG